MIFETARRRVSALGVIAAALSGWSCVDTDPVIVAAEAGVVSGEGGSAVLRACISCISGEGDAGPGCKAELAGCNGSDTCRASQQCSIDHGCFGQSARELVACGQECASESHVSHDDPAVALGYQLLLCISSACSDACFPKAL